MSPRRSAPQRKQNHRLPIWVVIVGIGVVLVIAVLVGVDFASKLQPTSPPVPSNVLNSIAVNGRTLGDPASAIDLVEFSDFQ